MPVKTVHGADFRLLGPVEVWIAGRPLSLGTAKQRAVLALLLIEAGNPVTVETMIDRLWDDAPPPRARNVLYSHLSRIRRLLAGVSAAAGEPVACGGARADT